MALDISSYLLGKSKGGGGEAPVLIDKTITSNNTYNASDDNADGYKKVVVNVPQPSGTINITQNGTVNVTDYASANVNVSADLSEYFNYSLNNGDAYTPGIVLSIKKAPSYTTISTNLDYAFSQCKSLIEIPLLDTSNVTSMKNMFNYCEALTTIPLLNTSSVTNMNYMFYMCIELTSIPNLNTSSVSNMNGMFYGCKKLTTIPSLTINNVYNLEAFCSGCTALTTVPLLNTSSVSGSNAFKNTFLNCPNLTDTSLDNILQMCINASSYNGTKTLAKLGFGASNYPTSRIQALPHYQDFIDAGWTIGY